LKTYKPKNQKTFAQKTRFFQPCAAVG